ncbi:MAG: glycoside hydrolase family 2 protein [Armatimonadota bacterium]|nr:hypothetical protein [bacterium]
MNIDLNGIWRLQWEALDASTNVPECEAPIDAAVPGDVHVDLVTAGLLPEPLVGVNVPLHEWVENASFTYERGFSVDADFDRAELVFNGLDCLADVFIDGVQAGSSANTLVPHTFDVTSLVKTDASHALRVRVDSGVIWGKQQDASKYLTMFCTERAFLRKPQFTFKWDWAPRLVNCGIWRDVTLKLYKYAALRDVLLTPTFDGSSAKLEARVQIEAFEAGDYNLSLSVANDQGAADANQAIALKAGMNEVILAAVVDDVQRWYPAGYGEQALYDVEVSLSKSGTDVDSWSTSYGFREITIVQRPINVDEKTFIVNVNGIDIFCKGANWVPADSIIARVTDEKYEALVDEALQANFNMFRIWGGGVYESDLFYDLCDRRGIMIWHDFMFACSEHPDDLPWYMDNVKDEVTKAVKRLRNHPSIALWCGNNEIDEGYGGLRKSKEGPDAIYHGYKIFHETIPAICADLDPCRFYWPSSPYGGPDPSSDQMGDKHAWDVSIHLPDMIERADIRNYQKDRGKFNSEYGMISYALTRSILEYTGEDKLDFSSPAYKLHDNFFNSDHGLTDWYQKVAFGSIPSDPQTYIDQSLAYQAMGYREAISDFRIRKPECAGSLFWMYSDCWGTLGWTIVDYYLRRKPSFYWVKKAYAPLAVFVRIENNVAKTYVVNDRMQDIGITVALEVANMEGQGKGVAMDLVAPANGVIAGPELKCGWGYAHARIEKGGRVRSEDLILTHFPSEMEVPEVDLDAEAKEMGDLVEVTIRSSGFGHFVYLDLPDGAVPSDNYFNMLPNRPKKIRVSGVEVEDILVGALNLRR